MHTGRHMFGVLLQRLRVLLRLLQRVLFHVLWHFQHQLRLCRGYCMTSMAQCALALFTCLCSMPAAVAAGPAIRELGKVTLSSSSGQISDISVTPAGDIYVLDANSLVITHFSATGALQNQFPISGVPESSQGHLYFHPEITVDQNRNVYIAATWRPAPRQTSTALFVFDSNGHYARTIPLIPRIEVRHLAIDKDGNFYALGVDPDFFKWKANLCLLVH